MACKNVLKTFKSVFITKNVTRKCAETLVNFATRLFICLLFFVPLFLRCHLFPWTPDMQFLLDMDDIMNP